MPIDTANFRDFYCGECIIIVASNKPYVDFTVPPDLNDYRWAEDATIQIYDPQGTLIVEDDMCRTGRVGWYQYKYCSSCEGCALGIYKVVITLTSITADCGSTPTTGSTSTTGSSGTPTSECSDKSVTYFRLIPEESI